MSDSAVHLAHGQPGCDGPPSMNFVGHLLLTEPSRAGWLGAILGDFVKGPLVGHYGAEIEQAIALHRAIDTFTDRHARVRRSVARLAPHRRRYGGILVDIFYDHFLVRHWARYGGEPLDALVDRTYALLTVSDAQWPARLRWVAPRMVAQDWLRNYGDREHVALTLQRVSTRLRRGDALATGIEDLDRHADDLEDDFHAFLPSVMDFARRWREASATLTRVDLPQSRPS